MNGSGLVHLVEGEDHTANNYYLLVEVRDNGDPYRSAYIRLDVKTKKKPVFLSNYSTSVQESLPINTELFTFVATGHAFVSILVASQYNFAQGVLHI